MKDGMLASLAGYYVFISMMFIHNTYNANYPVECSASFQVLFPLISIFVQTVPVKCFNCVCCLFVWKFAP